MYDLDTRKRAMTLIAQGSSLNSVSKQTGISRSAIREWRTRIDPLPRVQSPPCPRCLADPGVPDDAAAYSYLLGLYLGDGCISPHPRGGYYLRVACADAWPGLIDKCRAAITTIRPESRVCVLQKQGCVAVTSYSKHWPCLFPQHGPGKKHERPILLEPWQQEIVDAHPWDFIRGLVHSDGCRITNWTAKIIGGRTKRYEYTRYFFSNVSADILNLFTDTLDRVGVEWKSANQSRAVQNISIARKGSVALMDLHVGPKY
ncbi:transcriptional regulator [Streptomyces lunaelactis]|uniref:helix-turn-helix domain containing protein n=1 Tax=Streptomyces lunaelactis TaxID=1535768 RepID=UPI001584ACD2|nr:helix-turn-helix domain containing protein [Streptomyces lunaelactis]NUK07897.1 transcriptional regulator [Streptomyces lunaelactis]NUK49766.1 transcriptional regulator [Streptomyces lunaelactis]NUK60427.1 transcriptional regulator [Streptomyces lunaelactis]NUK67207.1 transcriptional regulator [Streptomyces lunaelactis]NUL12871.1 transcriptional regulator [Streptomyces lunaelactis]